LASESKSMQVKVTLTGGAKFIKPPTLLCVHSGNSTSPSDTLGIADSTLNWGALGALPTPPIGATENTTVFPLPTTNPTTGQASYSFAFPEGFIISKAGSGACLLTLSAAPYAVAAGGAVINSALVSTTPGTDVSLNVDVIYDDFFVKQTKSTAIKLISFVTAYKTEFLKTNPAANPAGLMGTQATIDVGTLSKKFISGLYAFGGHVKVVPSDTTRPALRNASGFGISAVNIIESASISVTGPTIATLSKVTFNYPTKIGGGVGACAESVIVEGSPSATSSGAVSDSVSIPIANATVGYSALVSATNNADHTGMLLCLVAQGVDKTLEAGYVTLTVNGITAAGKVVELGSSSSDFLNVKRNGTVVRVLNVPGAAPGVDPYRVNIRMFNTSNQPIAGDVVGSIYGVDGKVIADKVVLSSNLAANSISLVTSDKLISLVGKNWSGRAWMLIQAPIDPTFFKVQVLVKQPSGVLANISTDATD